MILAEPLFGCRNSAVLGGTIWYNINLSMTEEIEPHILKKYEIVEKLGKGAYGIVWKAVDRKLKQVVALKKVVLS